MNEERANDPCTSDRKKPYEKPRVKEYGSVAKLTAGGSGGELEGMSGMVGMN